MYKYQDRRLFLTHKSTILILALCVYKKSSLNFVCQYWSLASAEHGLKQNGTVKIMVISMTLQDINSGKISPGG